MTDLGEWFLDHSERGNPNTTIDATAAPGTAWTTGNRVEPLLHGATYFARLVACLDETSAGDEVYIADWRGDEDELLRSDGPRLGDLLCELARRGVRVRGLLWRSHPEVLGFNQEQQGELAGAVNEAGGEIFLDERVRRGGSHHQKLVVIHHPDRPEHDVGFVGGTDLCHGRRDDDRHLGDPQSERLDPAYGRTPPWHDIQAEVHGPALWCLAETFRERWNDRTPLERRGFRAGRVMIRNTKEDLHPDPIPRFGIGGAPDGGLAVQVLRTYPSKRPGYPFAPNGERSIARLYAKALSRARSLIYVEDQYFWSEEIAKLYEAALRRSAELHVIVVVPRHPDHNGTFSGPSSRLGQLTMIDRLRRVAHDRVAVYDLENERGSAVYVHSKVVVVDDTLALIGSDNMNRRSWTHDSELSIAILDDAIEGSADPGRSDPPRTFARELRLRLWMEHLALDSDEDLMDPVKGFHQWRECAAALDSWHESGARGPRPPGRVRVHRPVPVPGWQRVWAWPLYRLIVDPDGRPFRLRRARRF